MGLTPTQINLRQISGEVGAGLGIATGGIQIAIAAQGGAAAASGALTTAAVAVPIAGAIVAGLAVIASLIFHGADPRQVPAAKIEQVFEAAADKLGAMAKHGMISAAQAVAGQHALLLSCKAMLDQYHAQLGDRIYNGTLGNVTTTINNVITTTQKVLVAITLEIDPNSAARYYPQDGTTGWYAESVTTADQLVNHWLATLPKNFPGGAPAAQLAPAPGVPAATAAAPGSGTPTVAAVLSDPAQAVVAAVQSVAANPVQAAKALVTNAAAGSKTSLAVILAVIVAVGFILKNLFE